MSPEHPSPRRLLCEALALLEQQQTATGHERSSPDQSAQTGSAGEHSCAGEARGRSSLSVSDFSPVLTSAQQPVVEHPNSIQRTPPDWRQTLAILEQRETAAASAHSFIDGLSQVSLPSDRFSDGFGAGRSAVESPVGGRGPELSGWHKDYTEESLAERFETAKAYPAIHSHTDRDAYLYTHDHYIMGQPENLLDELLDELAEARHRPKPSANETPTDVWTKNSATWTTGAMTQDSATQKARGMMEKCASQKIKSSKNAEINADTSSSGIATKFAQAATGERQTNNAATGEDRVPGPHANSVHEYFFWEGIHGALRAAPRNEKTPRSSAEGTEAAIRLADADTTGSRASTRSTSDISAHAPKDGADDIGVSSVRMEYLASSAENKGLFGGASVTNAIYTSTSAATTNASISRFSWSSSSENTDPDLTIGVGDDRGKHNDLKDSPSTLEKGGAVGGAALAKGSQASETPAVADAIRPCTSSASSSIPVVQQISGADWDRVQHAIIQQYSRETALGMTRDGSERKSGRSEAVIKRGPRDLISYNDFKPSQPPSEPGHASSLPLRPKGTVHAAVYKVTEEVSEWNPGDSDGVTEGDAMDSGSLGDINDTKAEQLALASSLPLRLKVQETKAWEGIHEAVNQVLDQENRTRSVSERKSAGSEGALDPVPMNPSSDNDTKLGETTSRPAIAASPSSGTKDSQITV